MEISSAVASKIRRDRELLDIIRKSESEDQIGHAIFVRLSIPKIPKGRVSEEEREAFIKRVLEVSDQAGRAFSAIEGLTVHNLMSYLGSASVAGTVGALVKTLELDCVKDGIIGDNKLFYGASVG